MSIDFLNIYLWAPRRIRLFQNQYGHKSRQRGGRMYEEILDPDLSLKSCRAHDGEIHATTVIWQERWR